jgi:hypothetical protein
VMASSKFPGFLHSETIHSRAVHVERTCTLSLLQGSVSRRYPYTHRWLPEQHHGSDQHRPHRLQDNLQLYKQAPGDGVADCSSHSATGVLPHYWSRAAAHGSEYLPAATMHESQPTAAAVVRVRKMASCGRCCTHPDHNTMHALPSEGMLGASWLTAISRGGQTELCCYILRLLVLQVMPTVTSCSRFEGSSTYARDFGPLGADPMQHAATIPSQQTLASTTKELNAGTTRAAQHPPGYTGFVPATGLNPTAVEQATGSRARGDAKVRGGVIGYWPKPGFWWIPRKVCI